MTDARPGRATFVSMRTRHPGGFTIVEALVATVMFGVAGATLVASLAVMRAVRVRGLAEFAVARAASDHRAMLAHRACSAADTSGVLTTVDAVEHRWSATRVPEGWRWVDSVFTPGARQSAALAGSIRCR
jgi:type II secretory pathway pseudopilin PulG